MSDLGTFKWSGRDVALPVAAEEMDVATFVRSRLGFVPDEKQLAVLESTAKRGILNCSRQWGKSTVT
ncbi:MAG TPA: hypothetical protein VGM43_13040, partial [Bryobacteraceae bacterium]